MRILVGCEESQAVCIAFRERGHEAYSCDLQPCSGGHPEWHIQGDVFRAIIDVKPDLGIFFPPCTFMSKAGARWMYPKAGILDNDRFEKAMQAKSFFLSLLNCSIEKVCIENPQPMNIVGLPKPTTYIQPYEFGHPFSKKTLLWLKNLQPLFPTAIVPEYKPFLPSNTGGAKRGQKATYRNISQKDSSKTFRGVAQAMATQWG